jgi:hypothetical protein
MIVPTSKTRSVRIAPNAAVLRGADFSDSGDLVSPELLGAAMERIQKLLMRQPPTRERRCRACVSLSRATADCHHSLMAGGRAPAATATAACWEADLPANRCNIFAPGIDGHCCFMSLPTVARPSPMERLFVAFLAVQAREPIHRFWLKSETTPIRTPALGAELGLGAPRCCPTCVT